MLERLVRDGLQLTDPGQRMFVPAVQLVPAGSAIWTVTSLDNIAGRTGTLALRHRPHSANTQATSPNDAEHQAAEAARTAHAAALAGGWTVKQLSDAGLRPPKAPRTRTPRPEHTPARGENSHPPAEPAAPAAG
jgi:hypothetical protein